MIISRLFSSGPSSASKKVVMDKYTDPLTLVVSSEVWDDLEGHTRTMLRSAMKDVRGKDTLICLFEGGSVMFAERWSGKEEKWKVVHGPTPANEIICTTPSSSAGCMYPLEFDTPGLSIQLAADSAAMQNKWSNSLQQHHSGLCQAYNLTDVYIPPLTPLNKLTCLAPDPTFEGGLLIGDATGVLFYSTLKQQGDSVHELKKVARFADTVVQIEHVPGPTSRSFVVLSAPGDLIVVTLPPHSEDSAPLEDATEHRKVASGVSFFHIGRWHGKQLLCSVKSSALQSTVNVWDIRPDTDGRSKENFVIFREVYIPIKLNAARFLFDNALFFIGDKHLEMLDLDTLNTKTLFGPANSTLLDATTSSRAKPLEAFSVGEEVLAVFDKFAVYIDKEGKPSRGDKASWIYWDGRPDHFALDEQHIIACTGRFVQIRDVRTGEHVQTIGSSILSQECDGNKEISVEILYDGSIDLKGRKGLYVGTGSKVAKLERNISS